LIGILVVDFQILDPGEVSPILKSMSKIVPDLTMQERGVVPAQDVWPPASSARAAPLPPPVVQNLVATFFAQSTADATINDDNTAVAIVGLAAPVTIAAGQKLLAWAAIELVKDGSPGFAQVQFFLDGPQSEPVRASFVPNEIVTMTPVWEFVGLPPGTYDVTVEGSIPTPGDGSATAPGFRSSITAMLVNV